MRELQHCESWTSGHHENAYQALREVANWLKKREPNATVVVVQISIDDSGNYYANVVVEEV